jgi:molybdate transport system substrate-binding protein
MHRNFKGNTMKCDLKKILLTLLMIVGSTMHVLAAEHVTVYAASSLTDAINVIATQYQKQNGVEIIPSYGASSTLALQIEKNAPADIFISADQDWMDYCDGKEKIASGTRFTLLGNNLVLITGVASSLEKMDINSNTPWESLLGKGKLAVGDPEHVPAGKYAKEALQNLGAWPILEPRLAKAADVRAAMAMVVRREASLGIVYGSDTRASTDVKIVGTFPSSSHKRIEYPMAVVNKHLTPAVKAFYDYLKTPAAMEIFIRYGFTSAPTQQTGNPLH